MGSKSSSNSDDSDTYTESSDEDVEEDTADSLIGMTLPQARLHIKRWNIYFEDCIAPVTEIEARQIDDKHFSLVKEVHATKDRMRVRVIIKENLITAVYL
jgi:hypothetical protein